MQFEYQIKFSKRKTLTIIVERDRKIIVRAPENTSTEKIEEILQSKKQWLNEKINHAQKYPVDTQAKEFISGETLMYLGKNYQLLVVDEAIEGIDFEQRFRISKVNQPIGYNLRKELRGFL
jgi:predicted metal-dependent hydrolase